MNEFLTALRHELEAQDNRITADPIWEVQEEETIYGIDTAYTEEFVYMDEGYEEIAADELRLDEWGDPTEEGIQKVGVLRKWVPVQWFFSERAAREYMERQSHHHTGRLRDYVRSLYYNPEMKAIRDLILEGNMDGRAE